MSRSEILIAFAGFTAACILAMLQVGPLFPRVTVAVAHLAICWRREGRGHPHLNPAGVWRALVIDILIQIGGVTEPWGQIGSSGSA